MPSVAALVRQRAELDPGGLAVADVSEPAARTWTWHELSGQADRIAALLGRLGVRAGDTVALKMPNHGAAVVAALAALRAGAVICPLAPGLGRRETRLALAASRARVLLATAAEPGGDVPHQTLVRADGEAGAEPAGDGAPPPEAAGNRSGQLAFTSGTTGEVKPVFHHADELTFAARIAATRLRLTSADRVFVPCPLSHHSGFLYGMWLAWTTGCAQILPGRWDARRAIAAMRAWRATFTQLPPTMLVDLVDAVERGATPPRSLRVCVVTGAATSGQLAERATQALGTAVCRAWGSTETCMGTLSAPDDPVDLRCGTDGRALDGVRLRVTDATGAILPTGAEGGLEVRSPCQFGGYGTAPDLKRDAFTSDGWYRTGDLAVISTDGYLRVTGRVSDVVNRGGVKIPVPMVEHVLREHNAVADVAIVAVPDSRLGERACAFVVPVPGRAPAMADLQRHLGDQGMTRSYWPERLELVAQLPRNAAGKVQKALLRQAAADAAEHAAEDKELSPYA